VLPTEEGQERVTWGSQGPNQTVALLQFPLAIKVIVPRVTNG
jgi:hypothetical protein